MRIPVITQSPIEIYSKSDATDYELLDIPVSWIYQEFHPIGPPDGTQWSNITLQSEMSTTSDIGERRVWLYYYPSPSVSIRYPMMWIDGGILATHIAQYNMPLSQSMRAAYKVMTGPLYCDYIKWPAKFALYWDTTYNVGDILNTHVLVQQSRIA
jgi:hypothetical protein